MSTRSFMTPSQPETTPIPELEELLSSAPPETQSNGFDRMPPAAEPPPQPKKRLDTRSLAVAGSAVGTPVHVIRVLIVDDDRNECAAIFAALSQRLAIELVGTARDGAECLNLARRHTPDIVLLKDILQVVDCLRVAETIADELPEVAVILMTTGWFHVETRWRDLLHAGIAGFVTYPPSLEGLLEQIDHVTRHQHKLRSHIAAKTVQPQEPEQGPDNRRVVAFTGPRGGCGRSLVASNLAVLLAARSHSVCLVDLNSDSGDIAPLLDIHPNFTVGDLALAPEDIERQMIESVVVRHASGVNVIPAPKSGTLQGESLTPYFIQRLLGFTREQHDFTIVDTAPGLGGPVGPILGVADLVVMMIGFDLIRLQQGAAFIADLVNSGIDPRRIITVLACESDHFLIDLADAENILNVAITCVLPFDPATALQSVNNAVPFVVSSPHKPLTKAVQALARRLIDDIHPRRPVPWWKRALGMSRGAGDAY